MTPTLVYTFFPCVPGARTHSHYYQYEENGMIQRSTTGSMPNSGCDNIVEDSKYVDSFKRYFKKFQSFNIVEEYIWLAALLHVFVVFDPGKLNAQISYATYGYSMDIYRFEFVAFAPYGWSLFYIAAAIFSTHICIGWQWCVPAPQLSMNSKAATFVVNEYFNEEEYLLLAMLLVIVFRCAPVARTHLHYYQYEENGMIQQSTTGSMPNSGCDNSFVRGYYQALSLDFKDTYRMMFMVFMANHVSGGFAAAGSLTIVYPLDYAHARDQDKFGIQITEQKKFLDSMEDLKEEDTSKYVTRCLCTPAPLHIFVGLKRTWDHSINHTAASSKLNQSGRA